MRIKKAIRMVKSFHREMDHFTPSLGYKQPNQIFRNQFWTSSLEIFDNDRAPNSDKFERCEIFKKGLFMNKWPILTQFGCKTVQSDT